MSEDLVHELRSFAKAYPESVFLPLTDEQINEYSLVITRASAEMGRHVGPWMTRAADRIEALEAALREIAAEDTYLGEVDEPRSAMIARRALEGKP